MISEQARGATGRNENWRARARAWWSGQEESHRLLYRVGILLIASGALHGIVFLMKGGPLTGPVSWRKPMLFGFSIGITALALAYVAPALELSRKANARMMKTLAFAGILEVFLVSMQQWRGVPSHFNFFTTKFDRVIAGTVAGFISPVAVVIAIMFVQAMRRPLKAPPSEALAMRIGLSCLMLGAVVGGTIIANAITQFRNHTGHPPNVFGTAGVMKVPHALCLHGIQVMLVLAWLVRASPWSEEQRIRVVQGAALGYGSLILAMVLQTYSGREPFELFPPSLAALGVGVLLLGGAFAAALLGAWSGRVPAQGSASAPRQG